MKPMAFYPGCALQSMSWDYRESIRHVISTLDIELIEIKDWTCCGATAAHSLDERMSVILPARNLATAQAMELDVAVACPMCYKRLNYSRRMFQEKRVHDPWSLSPETAIIDLGRLLATESMIELVKDRVRDPLDGLRVVCYYGCQVIRPPKITGYTDYENPRHLDLLASAVGATAIDWSFKGTCCGASVGIPKKEIGLSLVRKLLLGAQASGADAIVVCCPLCQANLELYQAQLRQLYPSELPPEGVPILYYTEMLGIAFGSELIRPGLQSHIVDPLTLIRRVLGH